MTELVLMIIQIGLSIVQQQHLGGGTVVASEALVDIIAKAKAAYEKETGLPLDVSKIKPYEPI